MSVSKNRAIDKANVMMHSSHNNNNNELSDDDELVLSEHAKKALEEFYREKAETDVHLISSGIHDNDYFQENWELSQFWYDAETAEALAKVAVEVAGKDGRIACISCPTVASKLQKIKSNSFENFLFEYDERFKLLFGDNFIFYDYNNPLDIKEEWKCSFDFVMVDPPYLSQECLEKVSKTVHFLTKKKIVLCTGAVMDATAKELLGVVSCRFTPKHTNNLGNEFKCFANFDLDSILTDVNKLSSK